MQKIVGKEAPKTNWKSKFLKTVPAVDKDGNPIPQDQPLKEGWPGIKQKTSMFDENIKEVKSRGFEREKSYKSGK